MARTFENPANKHRETIDAGDAFGAFFLGMLYMLYKGLWGHVAVWFLVVAVAGATGGVALALFAMFLLSIGYSMGMSEILAKRYLNQGWREVKTPAESISPGRVANLEASAVTEPVTPASEGMKFCPYCAEEVKIAAIKCKHCQSDLPTVDIESHEEPKHSGLHIIEYGGAYLVGGYSFATKQAAQAYIADRQAGLA